MTTLQRAAAVVARYRVPLGAAKFGGAVQVGEHPPDAEVGNIRVRPRVRAG